MKFMMNTGERVAVRSLWYQSALVSNDQFSLHVNCAQIRASTHGLISAENVHCQIKINDAGDRLVRIVIKFLN